MTKFIGAIDQGTTSTRFMIFDDEGVEVARAQKEHRQILPRPGWVEHDAHEIFGIGREFLPEILASADSARYGEVSTIDEVRGVPIAGCLGDQQAALVGQACFHPGEVKNTYGTGNFMLMNTGRDVPKSKAGLLATACYRWADQPTTFGLEGSIAVTGSAVQWLRDQLGFIETAADIEPLAGS